ncbi:MAG: SIMPL domain-containing protein [Parvularculaceae bacterium]|nr:SIMPL domain-containing protein [Parvularculaceae bacterium]
MIRILAIAATATLLGGCLPDNDNPLIVVDGEGSASADPDQFSVRVQVKKSGENPSAALEGVSSTLKEIDAKLSSLEGLESVSIATYGAGVSPVYDQECAERARYNATNCPEVGSAGEAALIIKGTPAEAAGAVLSFLSELGATSIDFAGYSIAEESPLAEEADAAAMRDATLRAQRLARAAGIKLGPIDRVQYGEGFRPYDRYERDYSKSRDLLRQEQREMVTAYSPEVDLQLTPAPIEMRSKVTVAFRIAATQDAH